MCVVALVCVYVGNLVNSNIELDTLLEFKVKRFAGNLNFRVSQKFSVMPKLILLMCVRVGKIDNLYV